MYSFGGGGGGGGKGGGWSVENQPAQPSSARVPALPLRLLMHARAAGVCSAGGLLLAGIGGCSVGGVGEEGGHERAGDKGGPVETTEGLKTSETASTSGHKRERDGKGSCKGLATVATAVATGRRGGTTWLRSGARPAAAPTALALSPPPSPPSPPPQPPCKMGALSAVVAALWALAGIETL